MTSFNRPSCDLANAFLREVNRQGTNAGVFVDLLTKGNLADVARVSNTLLTSLDIATERFNQSPLNDTACRNLALALRSVALFGSAWQSHELRERGFEALRVAQNAALEAEIPPLSRAALRALTHLSPFFDTVQLKEISSPDGHHLRQGDDRPISSLNELTLASPRQLLLREGSFLVLDGSGATLKMAAGVLGGLRDALSGASSEPELKVGELLVWARDSIHALCILVPELSRSPAICNTTVITQALREAVDALSWVVMASNRIDGIAEGRFLEEEPLQKRIAWSHQLLELRDISWLALGLITRPSGPWADDYCSERQFLQARALERIQRDYERKFFSAGRLPMELFLCMTDRGDGYSGFEVEDVPAKVLSTLRQFEANGPCPPHHADGIGAALAGWDENMQGPGDEIYYAEQLRDLAAQALQGRAFQLDAQAMLIRTVNDVR